MPSAAACRGGAPGAARLADPLEHEHRVVHRQPEEDHEGEQRQPGRDRAVGLEARAGPRPTRAGRRRPAPRRRRRPTAGSARSRVAASTASGTRRAAGRTRAPRTKRDHERRARPPAGRRSRRPPPRRRSRAPWRPGRPRPRSARLGRAASATVSRTASSGRSGIGTATTAVRAVARRVDADWPRAAGDLGARSPSAAQRSLRAGASSRVPRTTSCARSGAPGKVRSIAFSRLRRRACPPAAASRRSSSCSAGTASAPRRQTAMTSHAAGRRVTPRGEPAPEARPAAAAGAQRGAANGSGRLSIRSPSSASIGGQHGQRAEHRDRDDEHRRRAPSR